MTMTQSIDLQDKLVARFAVDPAAIEAKRADYAALSVDAPGGYEQVRLAIAECRSTRTAIEAKRKELKADALEYGRRVDSIAKGLTGLVLELEDPLQAQKDRADEAKAAAKKAKEEAARAELEARLKAEREAEEARLAALRAAEEARLAAEREAQRVERERLAAERKAFEAEQRAAKAAAEKAAAEERQRREAQERMIADARAADEAKARALREAEERKLAAERAALEAQRRETERLEQERLARIQAAEEAERARIAAEEAAVKERERQAAIAARLEALKPDAEKLKAFAAQIRAMTLPDVQDEEAKHLAKRVMARLIAVAWQLEQFGNGQTEDEPMVPRLNITVKEDPDGAWATIRGEVNGKTLFEGHYGGEPEDNSRNRDYHWVEPAIIRVAKLGGVQVDRTVTEDCGDDEDDDEDSDQAAE
jgi:hypothetical protein